MLFLPLELAFVHTQKTWEGLSVDEVRQIVECFWTDLEVSLQALTTDRRTDRELVTELQAMCKDTPKGR